MVSNTSNSAQTDTSYFFSCWELLDIWWCQYSFSSWSVDVLKQERVSALQRASSWIDRSAGLERWLPIPSSSRTSERMGKLRQRQAVLGVLPGAEARQRGHPSVSISSLALQTSRAASRLLNAFNTAFLKLPGAIKTQTVIKAGSRERPSSCHFLLLSSFFANLLCLPIVLHMFRHPAWESVFPGRVCELGSVGRAPTDRSF